MTPGFVFFNLQLFTLVSDLYCTGTMRDMKRWVYEIHSTFIVRDAPLAIKLDDSVVEGIENILKVCVWDLCDSQYISDITSALPPYIDISTRGIISPLSLHETCL